MNSTGGGGDQPEEKNQGGENGQGELPEESGSRNQRQIQVDSRHEQGAEGQPRGDTGGDQQQEGYESAPTRDGVKGPSEEKFGRNSVTVGASEATLGAASGKVRNPFRECRCF